MFLPVNHSSQPEQTAIVKEICSSVANICHVVFRFMIFCLSQVWKPIYPKAGCCLWLHYEWPAPSSFWFVCLPPFHPSLLLSSEHLQVLTIFPKPRVAETWENTLYEILTVSFSCHLTFHCTHSKGAEWPFVLTQHVHSHFTEVCVSL